MLLIASSVLITLALISYSIGVWAERISRYLKPWHLLFFWTGFVFDVSGTLAMHKLAQGKFNILEPHTFTGQLALWLMFVHALWASYVIKRHKEYLRKRFHRYSLLVWLIWLIPYFGGMLIGMGILS